MRIKKRKTPGQKLIAGMSLKSKFWICFIAGLAFIGVGLLSILNISTHPNLDRDFSTKTLLQILFIAFICLGIRLFGKAMLFETLIKVKKAAKKKRKKLKNRMNSADQSQQIIIQKNPQN